MATYRPRASGTVEACINRKALPGRVFLTFKTIEDAKAYCSEVEARIDAGDIPPEILKFAKPKEARRDRPDNLSATIRESIDEYIAGYSVKDSDVQWLNVMASENGAVLLSEITVQWALGIVGGYKRTKKLAPETIKKRIGSLRRCLDWHVTIGKLPINPLKLLPQRYATYNDTERAAAGSRAPEESNERDRRLEYGDDERIRKVLRNDHEYIRELNVERGIKPESEAPMTLLYDMAIETAMRLREMYTLSKDQINLDKRTIFLDRTKNGDKRQVPLSSVMVELLTPHCKPGDSGLLFPYFWNGDLSKENLRKTTSKMSGRWRTIARLAKCYDLHMHDLRHEATCRFYERTTLSDLQIAKITGHRDLKSLRRYANLRASNLAESLW